MTSNSNGTGGGGVRIGKYSEEFLLKRASDIVKEKTKSSTVFDEEAENSMPKFDRSEITLGRVLGRGGFSTVSEIKGVTIAESTGLNGATSYTHGDDEEEDGIILAHVVQDRRFISQNCRRKGKDARYAMKELSSNLRGDPERFIAGIIDLAIEARFLAVIKHPNIIKMRATATSNPYEHGYFVVLDRLYDTLTKKFTVWKKEKAKVTGISKIRDMKGKKKKDLWVERLHVCYDLASALRHLHSLNILYRDLKPNNIGFDVRGDVKIFDFGLAKEVVAEERMEDGLYKLSGNTGSLRFMAPEVALEKPYDFSVDVYSFSVLMWQICSLETPYSGYSVSMHHDHVIQRGHRPKINSSWSPVLANLMRNGWSKIIRDRPNFEEIIEVLRNEVSDLMGDADISLDVSNRTAKSMQAGK